MASDHSPWRVTLGCSRGEQYSSPWRACPLKFRTFAKLETFLSALLFIEMICEVGLAKLNLENLKTEILVKNVKKAESTQDFSPAARPQLAFGE